MVGRQNRPTIQLNLGFQGITAHILEIHPYYLILRTVNDILIAQRNLFLRKAMIGKLQVNELRRSLTDDVLRLLGIPQAGLPRHLLKPFLLPPTTLFAKLAASFDHYVEQFGMKDASNWALSKFVKGVEISGVERIPADGPLLIAANHPGTIDGFAITANVPRPDLKIVITGIPFIQKLQSTGRHLIYATFDPHQRMTTVRSIIRQLEEGGALLIFPSGTIDPDPDIMPGSREALNDWSPSLELILRRVPQTQVLVSIVSGVLNPSYLNNPFARLHRGIREQQKVAEFLQIAQQLVFPKFRSLLPRVSFGSPMNMGHMLSRGDSSTVLKDIVAKAQELLNQHSGKFGYE
jgi:hypothetical protein